MKEQFRRKIVRRNQKGQTIVEYIIIVAVVAVAALTALYIFSDRVREMITGVTSAIGGNNTSGADKSSKEILEGLNKDGVDL